MRLAVALFLLIAIAAVHAQRSNCTCCLQPIKGRCLAFFPSWYYDCKQGACKKFVYGGCGGNSNRFDSEKSCKRSCSNVQCCYD